MSTQLPQGWTAYKTPEGKEYYYHAQSKVTQWNRPSAPAKSTQSSTAQKPPAGGGGDRGGLLAQIQQGTKLKKAVTRESSPLETLKAEPRSTGSGTSSGGGNPLFAAIAGGAAALKKVNRSNPPPRAIEPSPAHSETSPSGGGGFADIMRKNREAAARKSAATSSGNTSPVGDSAQVANAAHVLRKSFSNLASSTDVQSGNNSSLEAQLNRIESKLDKLLAHLNIE